MLGLGEEKVGDDGVGEVGGDATRAGAEPRRGEVRRGERIAIARRGECRATATAAMESVQSKEQSDDSGWSECE